MGAPYTQYGPFTNGSATPGISATFLNNLETFLLELGSAAYDNNITSDGSGDITSIGTITFHSAAKQVIYRSVGGGSVLIDVHDDKNFIINVPNVGGSGKLFIQVGGVNKASIDGSGNMILAGTLTQSGTP